MVIRKQKPLIGISIFAILIFIDSMINIGYLISFSQYKEAMAGFSEKEILWRYLFAWGIRGLWLAATVGVLVHKEKFRKVLVAVSILAILSVYWKFPYAVVVQTTEPIYQNYISKQSQASAGISLEKMTWLVTWILYVMDSVFAGCVIFYFTRVKVKKYFR